jgi:hypothetical protein
MNIAGLLAKMERVKANSVLQRRIGRLLRPRAITAG